MTVRSRRPAFRLLGRLRDDAGVAAVVVAIALVAVFGAAVLTIDAGSVWTTRRAVITASDAAALAAAKWFDEHPGSVCASPSSGNDEALTVLQANDPAAALEEFVPNAWNGDCSSGAGHVVVTARLEAQSAFAGLFGQNELSALSVSVAQWGPLVSATGMRPIGICDKGPHFVEWSTLSPSAYRALMSESLPHHANSLYPGATSPVHRVLFEKVGGGSDCSQAGDGTGNWGWLDFDGTDGQNGSTAVDFRLVNGYDGTVALTPHDCNPAQAGVDDCPTKTGALAQSTNNALRAVACPAATPTDQCPQFPIVVYDGVTGSGSNTRYRQVAFVGVVLRGWNKVTGTPGPDSWFDVEFIRGQFTGSVGPNPSGAVPTVHGVQLCGVDHDAAAPNATERCAV